MARASKKKVVYLGVTGVAAGAGLAALAAGPAMAGTATLQPTHWHLNPTGTITGKAQSAFFSSSNVFGQCAGSTTSINASGSIPSASVSGNPAGVAHLRHVSFKNCSIGGVTIDATVASSAEFSARGYSSASGGTTTGNLVGIHATVTGVGNSCKASISGSLPVSYHNATGTLVVDPTSSRTLHVVSANAACGGLTASHLGAFEATFTVTPPVHISGS